jgi:4-hydroxy-3-methylbut-2-enyl diphosphate reductase
MQMDPAHSRVFYAGATPATEIVEHVLEQYGLLDPVSHERVQDKKVLKNKAADCAEHLSVLVPPAGHPEIEGIGAQVPSRVYLVRNVTAVAVLPLRTGTAMAYITRNTLCVDDTRDTSAPLWARFTDVQGPDIRDICYATQSRQSAVRDLDKLVDVILVAGAPNCSNSNRPREIGTEADVASNLIADGSKLNPDWPKDAKAVGITAGASAPEVPGDNVVEDKLIEALRRIGPIAVSVLAGREENIEFRLPAEPVAG